MPLDYQVITDSTPTTSDLTDCLTGLIAAVAATADVDLIHAIYGTFTGVAAVSAAALRTVPVVVTTFGRDVSLGASVDPRYKRLMKIAYGHADVVIASDDAAANLVSLEYVGSHTDVRVLPPGMNFTMLRDAAAYAPRRARAHRILAVQSSFNEKKGLPVLLDAVAALAPSLPDVELVVAGHDDTPGARIEKALRAQAAALGITDRVQLIGHLEHHEVAALMGECDVLVDPRTINSFSSCLYEAMTTGLPVVASDMPCNRAALGDGAYGLLTRAGDVRSLADGLHLVLTDRQLADRLRTAGGASARSAESEIGYEAVGEKLHTMYAGLVRTAVCL
jgi:glycosyltransferase involved in cell wall biosynthesis